MPGMGGGMSAEEFRELAQAFIEAGRQADGSVRPVRMAMAGMDMDMPGMEMAEAEHEEEHNELAEVMHMEGDEHPPEEHEDEYAEDEEEDEHAEE